MTAPGEVDTLSRVAPLIGVKTTAVDPMVFCCCHLCGCSSCCHSCRCSLAAASLDDTPAITPMDTAPAAIPVDASTTVTLMVAAVVATPWMPLLLLLLRM